MVAVAQKTNVAARTRGCGSAAPKPLTPDLRGDKSENRLIKSESLASVPDAAKVKVENLYDYMGRRVKKTVSSDYSGGFYTTTNVTTYMWDGFNIIAEMSDAGYTNWYTYGLDLSGTLQGAGGVGGALAMTRDTGTATNTYLYCFDGNGNVVNLVDAGDGIIAATYEYSPFGSLIRSTGTMADDNPVRWSTKHTDDETGLVMYELRAYSPGLGRFIRRDPVQERGGRNLYCFVKNRPIFAVDRLGLLSLCEIVGCCDKCDEDDEPIVLSADIDFRNWNATGDPDLNETAIALLEDLALLQLIQLGGGIASGCAGATTIQGALSSVLLEVADYGIGEGMTGGWTDQIIGAIDAIEDNLIQQQGVRIWVHLSWIECRERKCWIIFDRLDWKPFDDWFRCDAADDDDLPFGFGGTPIDEDAIANAIPGCLADAIENLIPADE